MALNLALIFGSPPDGQEFPGTPKALGDFLAQYFQIVGGSDFVAINFGPNEPDSDHRDAPWFKTDNDGNPLGWFSWNGAEWKQMPNNIPAGGTASRPSDAVAGTPYYDADIGTTLIFNGSDWTTLGGTPGDLKFVYELTLEAALTMNPGWNQADPATFSGRVLGAAGEGTGLTPRNFGDSVGEEDHTLIIDEIPEHQHTAFGINNERWTATAAVVNAAGNLSGWGSNLVSSNPPTGEGGLAHNTMQPTRFLWLLIKAF